MYILLLFKNFFMEKKIYLAMLHKIGINQKKLHIIFKNNSDYKDFFDNLSYNILFDLNFTDKQIEYILKEKKEIDINKIKEKLESRNVNIVTINDENYPYFLKQVPNFPYLFYLRWKIDNSPKIAVVWSRKITSYWESAIEKIVWDISSYFTIISWWAAWCDTKAHQVAISHWNKTISIIGTWIDIDYPVLNKKLYDNIVFTGWWIISIFPIWEVWNSYNFPIRNEIVAWLSVWVLVVEAKSKSWTLITSNLALDLWKDLFAVPWDFFKLNSEWCNNLIKKWMAKLVTCSEDILVEYNILSKNINKKRIDFSDLLEEEIYNLLILEWLTIDQIANKIWISVSVVSFKLSMLEINKLIKKNYWWKYEVF